MASRSEFLLRPMTEADLPQVLEWRNSDRVRVNMYTDQPISFEDHYSWFAKASIDPCARYFIFECAEIPIGVVNIVQIDSKNGKCSWGFYLGDTNAPKTSGPAMEFLALEYMFESLGLRKVYCEVFMFNEPVIKLHKKFGFVEEGVFVGHILKNGTYEDVVSLALFKETWESLKPRLEKLCFRE